MRAAPPRLRSSAAPADRGGIVLGWLTKVTIVLAVIGIALFDAISIGSTAATVSDQGSYAARDASSVWDQTKDLQKTYDAAVASATLQDPQNVLKPKGFSVDPDGTVHLVIGRQAPTLVLFRWERTKKWAYVERPAEGRSVGD